VLGQAQTGTGKTAAFALPILSRIDIKQTTPQALVLAPTRELAIQVAEAFQRYAAHIPGFHVLPIYGGQSYGPQLSALRRGVHVVVGTPGRVIDHLDKGSLDLSKLKTLVLDEADEMLRMGFIDDVERILQETPDSRQTALFSATMPSAIRRIANTYLRNPGNHHRRQDRHRRKHPPALLAGVGHAQARRADPHPGSRELRRHDHLLAHQARHRGTGQASCRRAASRPPPSMATSSSSSASAPSSS
jgi:superfamily II DNA/RNA helicase